jgi:hypothetical protein
MPSLSNRPLIICASICVAMYTVTNCSSADIVLTLAYFSRNSQSIDKGVNIIQGLR